MIQRLYIHNFRCLENFELPLAGVSSVLLIGKNGAGKSTIRSALEILQSVGRGINRIGQLVQPKDFARGRSDVPIRFEIEVLLDKKLYKYILALELPAGFKELRIYEEQLIVSGEPLYTRQQAQVTLHSGARPQEAKFLVDWHLNLKI
jgi:predicted ATPase